MIKYPASAVKPDLGLQAQSLSKRPKSYNSSLKNFKTNYWDIMCKALYAIWSICVTAANTILRLLRQK